MGFADLPNEILTIICCYISIPDLKTVRRLSQTFKPPATQRLFRVLILKPHLQSIQRWNNVFADTELQCLVKFAVIETFPDLYWDSNDYEYIDGQYDKYKGWILPEGFIAAIGTLSQGFLKTCSIKIKFSRDVTNEPRVSRITSAEPPTRRRMLLESVFTTLAIRSVNNELANVDVLKVSNLSNFTHDTIAVSNSFQMGMRVLKELHIQVRQDVDPVPSENEFDFPGDSYFMPHLKSQWLEPIASQLTSLSLYFDEYWGVVPILELKGMKFPRLRSLALGNYTFGYEWQLDWLISLTSLEILMLENCPILLIIAFFDLEMQTYGVDASGWRRVRLNNMEADPYEGDEVFENPARWSRYFDRIRGLPNLVEFGFGCADWSSGADKVSRFRALL